MNILRCASVTLVSLFLAVFAFAADASPAGEWKWSIATPTGDAIEVSLQLEVKDGKLAGDCQSPFGVAPISQGSFKDGSIEFSVEREFDGNTFVVKYTGKLEGDTIKGTIELPGFGDGEGSKQEWHAKRVK